MKVLIVGGGIGGLALAAFLKDSGIEYEIIEKCSDWQHQGFIIGLWDNGRDMLKKLGLAERLDHIGSRIQTYSIRDGHGKIVREYSLAHLQAAYGGAVTIIGRADIHAWLLEKCDVSKIQMSTSVEKIVAQGNEQKVTFTDGRIGIYDVVVGADGVHSKVRSLIFSDAIESYTNWRAWFMWVENEFDVPATIAEYIEPREFIVTFAGEGKTLATMVTPLEHTVWDTEEGRIKRLEQIFKDETHLVPKAFRSMHDKDALPTDLIDIKMRHWVKGNVVLLGDAAHAFGPMAGLGASMTMEDAYTLAAALSKASEGFPLSHALKTYEQHRKHRTAIARRVTRKIRNIMLIKSPFLRKVVNYLAPYMPEQLITGDYERLLKTEI